MKISVERPNVEKYRIRLERDDPKYHECMWADILFDHDAYVISATSDCGNFAHRWPATDRESFRDLCLRMLKDEEYLLGKFSSRDRFDLEESRMLFRDLHPDEPELTARVMAVRAGSDREWVEELEEIGVSEPWEYIVRDYPHGAKVFVFLLKNVVFPMMRRGGITE